MLSATVLTVAAGICQAVVPCDEAGNPIPNATDPKARTLSFEIDPKLVDAPKDQMTLKGSVELALTAIRRLYPGAENEPTFRRYFVQIAGAAQVGLAGMSAHPDVATQALSSTVADLIDTEGARIKNGHLRDLAQSAWTLSWPLLTVYLIARGVVGVDPKSLVYQWLLGLDVHPLAVSCFMVMLVGCFLGVVLSYAARTTVMGLTDIVSPDTDQLRPVVRLAVSGGWTVLVGYLLSLEIVVLKFGPASSQEFVDKPMLAFLIGAICGLTNLTLPGSVMKKVSDLLPLK